jgi:hypothetical protein
LRKKAGNCGERREAIIFTPKRKTQLGISVPIHGNSPLKIGRLRHLMKVAGIDESEL